ncbi:MAG TPA: response regulator [Tepidisphaeraceae bacterium]|nr:response regulator [Tepidisphaeraceae bacterium]
MDADSESSSVESGKILLCDDSQTERSALASYLNRQGYLVDEADEGRSAIEYLKNHEVDLVLLDLQMPGMDGFDVLTYLQEHRRGLPVILLSGMPVEQIQQKIYGLPTHALPPLFLKPVDLNQLLQVLKLQLSGQMPDLKPSAEAPNSSN